MKYFKPTESTENNVMTAHAPADRRQKEPNRQLSKTAGGPLPTPRLDPAPREPLHLHACVCAACCPAPLLPVFSCPPFSIALHCLCWVSPYLPFFLTFFLILSSSFWFLLSPEAHSLRTFSGGLLVVDPSGFVSLSILSSSSAGGFWVRTRTPLGRRLRPRTLSLRFSAIWCVLVSSQWPGCAFSFIHGACGGRGLRFSC